MASKASYGSNPHAGVVENANRDWGPYQWPGGVPESLLGNATLTWEPTQYSLGIRVRKELVPLVNLMLQIAQQKYGRTFERGYTGGYANRPIGGTHTPSNHSKGRSIDFDAQFNPQSNTFICDLPPALVADWESIGFYWGGRYVGAKYDPMHFTYVGAMGDLAGDEAKARAILLALHPAPEKPSPAPIPENRTPASTPAPVPNVPASPVSEEDDMQFFFSSTGGKRPALLVVGGVPITLDPNSAGATATVKRLGYGSALDALRNSGVQGRDIETDAWDIIAEGLSK